MRSTKVKKLIAEVETLEELKQVYKKLALIHHPDRGGDEEIMKQLNNEYDDLFDKLKNTHKNSEGEFYTKETEEVSEEWRELISKLLKLKMIAVEIEVIGSFLWVSGNTRPYKEQLGKNGLGLRWSNKKKAWYKSPKGYRRFTRKEYDMKDIRTMYGSQKIKDEDKRKAIAN